MMDSVPLEGKAKGTLSPISSLVYVAFYHSHREVNRLFKVYVSSLLLLQIVPMYLLILCVCDRISFCNLGSNSSTGSTGICHHIQQIAENLGKMCV